LLPAIAPVAVSTEVTAVRLDGGTIVGELQTWDEKGAAIDTTEGEKRIASEDLLSLRWRTGDVEAAANAGLIELTDGSLVPIAEFTTSGSEAEVKLADSVTAGSKELPISKKHLAAVRLHPMNDSLAKQWDEIRDLKAAADVLVLMKRDGKSLDYVEGVLGNVSPYKVEFELDGDKMSVDREKVAGFIYFRRESTDVPEASLIIHGRSGLKASIASALLKNSMLQLTTADGARLEWPVDDIVLADYSAGKLLYLSDLEPASTKFTPLVAIPPGTSVIDDYGQPRRNQSAYGGALTLSWPEDLQSSPEAAKNTYAKGLALHSRTEMVYRLPAGYRRLTALAGIEPDARASGHVRLEIFGDDEPLAIADIDGTGAPQPIDVEIEGVKRLKIIVDYGKNLDTGDWLNLCDLKVVK
jgi:hypothetical protein